MVPFYTFQSWAKNNIIDKTNHLELIDSFFIDNKLSKKWELEEITYLNVKTLCSYIFRCKSKYGNCILKITDPEYELYDVEVNAILNFKGNNCCKIYDYDQGSYLQLLEELSPGTSICNELLEDRLKIAINIAPGTKIIKENCFSNYFNIIPDYLSRSEKFIVKYPSIKELNILAINLLHEIQSNDLCLIHGDYHYENIIKSNDTYKFIDPKGILGLKYMDYAQLLNNELKIKGNKSDLAYLHFLIDFVSNLSNTTYSAIAKWFFIENVWRFNGSLLYMNKTEKYIFEKIELLKKYIKVIR